ncbi:hypothetical protein PIB30_032123 [Stylosanthes scabra]|uniref:DUF4283 domain-containing protein n=1 Tax=Stylosanthes scabra TaxID=79078 RepID=A0ABU6VAY3_9FABA|nr:hypothetical protein [Stylosanthes scabra]
MESVLFTIWGQPSGFKVQNHGGNMFQFYFDDVLDIIRIEKGAPWLFKNYIINLKRWQEGVTIDEKDFAIVPLWIQFWGLLEHCKTKELGQKIGSSMGEVLEVESFHMRGNDEKIMKAHIGLDVTKPLRRIVKIAGPDQKVIEVKLNFIGHEARACKDQIEDAMKGEVEEEKWGS